MSEKHEPFITRRNITGWSRYMKGGKIVILTSISLKHLFEYKHDDLNCLVSSSYVRNVCLEGMWYE